MTLPRSGDVALAALLAAAGVLEALVGPGADGSRAVSAVALAGATLPLAWRRAVPLAPLAAVAIAFIAQAPLDGFLVGDMVTPLVALAIALYSAGRYAGGPAGAAAGALGVVVVTGTRVAVDPAAQTVGHAVLTLVAVALPFLVGRWVRGQTLLRRRLRRRAERLARDRERDARQAAEEERLRIAGDLQAAIAGDLDAIAERARDLARHLETGEGAAARSLLASIAATARAALADVRRVLGILRRDGQAPSLAPPERPAAAPVAPAPAARPALAPRHRRPDERALDALFAAAVLAGVVLGLVLAVPAGDRAVAAATALPIVAPLLWRRRHPVAVVVAVFAAVALQSALLELDAFPVADIAAVVCATYAVGAHAERSAAVAGLAAAAAGAAVHAALFYPSGVVAALLGGVAGPWVVGRVIRSHRELTRQSREEAARAEQAREREARAAVTSERMRIARELHDAVAHNISVIAIQAGGAAGVLDRDPERAASCAALIQAVAREARSELGRLVGGLDGAPQPGLAHVDALAARARSAGQPVELRVEGAPATLPAGIDLAAYRIVQEALANASKHAGGARARVLVRYARNAVEVEVADDGRGGAGERANGTGHGLIGIRERVALYGGTLDAGRQPSGGFRVHARLPLGAA